MKYLLFVGLLFSVACHHKPKSDGFVDLKATLLEKGGMLKPLKMDSGGWHTYFEVIDSPFNTVLTIDENGKMTITDSLAAIKALVKQLKSYTEHPTVFIIRNDYTNTSDTERFLGYDTIRGVVAPQSDARQL